MAFVVSVWVWEFTHKYPQIRQKYRTKYGFVIDFISEGTDGSQRNNRRRRCAAILFFCCENSTTTAANLFLVNGQAVQKVQRNSRRRRCAAILLSTEQTNKKGKLGLPFNLYIDPLFNLHEWIALACYKAIEVSYAALIWLLFLAMGDIEVVIAE